MDPETESDNSSYFLLTIEKGSENMQGLILKREVMECEAGVASHCTRAGEWFANTKGPSSWDNKILETIGDWHTVEVTIF